MASYTGQVATIHRQFKT